MIDRCAAYERKIMRVLFLVIAVLMMLCLVALLVLSVLRMTMKPDDNAEDNHQDVPTSSLNGEQEPNTNGNGSQTSSPGENIPANNTADVLLAEGADMGQGYIDSMVFFGESTTAHLRSRGVLSGGTATKQIWADETGTMTLSLDILSKKIIYPETGERLTIEQAVALKKPKYIVLSFGINNLINFKNNERLYTTAYSKLISAIQTACPQTTVILQTVYPVGVSQTSFSQEVSVINGYVETLNGWLLEIAKENGAYVVDTASCLKDSEGNLRNDYATSDGLHLTTAAYGAILDYLRTHGCP